MGVGCLVHGDVLVGLIAKRTRSPPPVTSRGIPRNSWGRNEVEDMPRREGDLYRRSLVPVF